MMKEHRPNQTTLFDDFDAASIERESIKVVDHRREARERIEPKAKSLRAQLLEWLSKRPNGATDEEMQEGVPMSPSTQRPRRGELVRDGLVRKMPGNGRKTRSGRSATVWEAVPE